MDECYEDLFLRMKQRGYRGRVVSIHHLSELKDEIMGRFEKRLFDEEFYRSRLSFFDFEIPVSLPGAKSIIIIAVPRPQAQAVFTFGGKAKTLVLPPTYVGYDRTTNSVGEFLSEALQEKEHKVATTKLPLKLLAVRSGLAEYGINNITYVSGLGSFLQLVAFYSDRPCSEDAWCEAQTMKVCEKCQACRRACPTKAVSTDRFLLHAERCISFRNEMKGETPFPSWIDPSWHNCLFGCFHCQRVCPVNTPFLNWVEEKEEFSQEETELLLKGQLLDLLPGETLQKLRNLDMADPYSLDSLPRNLRAFFGPTTTAVAWQPRLI